MKEKITLLQQLIVGSLIKFKSLNTSDVSVLIEMLEMRIGIAINEEEAEEIKNYIYSNDRTITLEEILNSKYFTNVSDNYTKLQTLSKVQSDVIKEFFKELDIEEFVLRKVQFLGGFPIDYTERFFNGIQQEKLNKLYDKGYLEVVWKDDIIYDDYRETRLSHSGLQMLFKIDNAQELLEFKQQLKISGYDINLIDDFLRSQNLSQGAHSILNIENFNMFCNIYDRCPYALDKSITDEQTKSNTTKRIVYVKKIMPS